MVSCDKPPRCGRQDNKNARTGIIYPYTHRNPFSGGKNLLKCSSTTEKTNLTLAEQGKLYYTKYSGAATQKQLCMDGRASCIRRLWYYQYRSPCRNFFCRLVLLFYSEPPPLVKCYYDFFAKIFIFFCQMAFSLLFSKQNVIILL